MKKFKLNSKRIICFVVLLAMVFTSTLNNSIYGIATRADSKKTILIASTTDFHANLGRISKASTLIKKLRKDYDNDLILDNGDIFQGKGVLPFVNLFFEKFKDLFPDELKENYGKIPNKFNAIAAAFKEINYDAITLGNHEFNYPYTSDSGFQMQDIYEYIKEDSNTKILAANIYKEGTEECAFTPYITKTFGKDGPKVAVIGFEQPETFQENIAENHAGLRIEKNIVNVYNKYVRYENGQKTIGIENKKENVDFVVVSYHNSSPKYKDLKPDELKKEKEDITSIVHLLANTDTIDLVIAGHDHKEMIQTMPNKKGADIHVMNAGGKNLATAIIPVRETDGKWSLDPEEKIKCENKALDEKVSDDKKLSENENIKNIQEYAKQISELKLGTISTENWDMGCSKEDLNSQDQKQSAQIIRNKLRMKNSDTTTLVLKSMIWAAKKQNEFKSKEGTWVAAYCPGTGKVAKPGEFKVKNLFDIYEYDNSFYVITDFSVGDLKKWMEKVASYWDNGNWTSKYPDYFNIAVFGGLDYIIDVSKPVGNRVTLFWPGEKKQVPNDTEINLVLDNYQFGSYGAFGNLFKDKIEKPKIWSSSNHLGPFDGLIKIQLAKYIMENKEIKHNNTNGYKWEVCGLNPQETGSNNGNGNGNNNHIDNNGSNNSNNSNQASKPKVPQRGNDAAKKIKTGI